MVREHVSVHGRSHYKRARILSPVLMLRIWYRCQCARDVGAEPHELHISETTYTNCAEARTEGVLLTGTCTACSVSVRVFNSLRTARAHAANASATMASIYNVSRPDSCHTEQMHVVNADVTERTWNAAVSPKSTCVATHALPELACVAARALGALPRVAHCTICVAKRAAAERASAKSTKQIVLVCFRALFLVRLVILLAALRLLRLLVIQNVERLHARCEMLNGQSMRKHCIQPCRTSQQLVSETSQQLARTRSDNLEETELNANTEPHDLIAVN